MNEPTEPKGRDIMAVITFYNGEVIEQKYQGLYEFIDLIRLDQLRRYIPDHAPTELVDGDKLLNNSLEKQFIHFDNGVIRQTKDIEKIVWSYC